MRVQGTVDKGAFGIITPYLAWSTHVCTMYGRDPGAKWMANIQSSLQYVLPDPVDGWASTSGT